MVVVTLLDYFILQLPHFIECVLLSFKLLEVELLLVFQLALVTFDIFFL
jgi:hypothetical protein